MQNKPTLTIRFNGKIPNDVVTHSFCSSTETARREFIRGMVKLNPRIESVVVQLHDTGESHFYTRHQVTTNQF